MVSFLRCEFLMMEPQRLGWAAVSARQLCAKQPLAGTEGVQGPDQVSFRS